MVRTFRETEPRGPVGINKITEQAVLAPVPANRHRDVDHRAAGPALRRDVLQDLSSTALQIAARTSVFGMKPGKVSIEPRRGEGAGRVRKAERKRKIEGDEGRGGGNGGKNWRSADGHNKQGTGEG